MKNLARKYQFIKTELTSRNENELKDAIYIYARLGYSTSKIHELIYLNQYRYR
jgi:repressor of nif and glnA expression